MNDWDAEVPLSIATVEELINNQCAELAPCKVQPLGEGWDNYAWLVNDRVVFRFPRRTLAVRLLQTETRALQYLPELPLEVPRPKYIGHGNEIFPYDFAGYVRIEGLTACQVHPTDAMRLAMAPVLGHFLRCLHAAPIPDLPGDEIGRLDIPFRAPKLEANLQKLEDEGLISARHLAFTCTVPPVPACTVHGDLYPRHLVLDRASRLTGVIDWGDIHRGHPAIDLSIAHSFLPPAAHNAFVAAYGPVSPETWQVARWRALHHSAYVALYAHSIEDDNLLEEALRSLRHLGGQ